MYQNEWLLARHQTLFENKLVEANLEHFVSIKYKVGGKK